MVVGNKKKPPPLNSVCPYYTMFPIDFPRRVLARANVGDVVLDPFCGRGTTLYAAREAGLEAHGVDVSRVAISISRAKLATASVDEVLRAHDDLVASTEFKFDIPISEFWSLAFHQDTLASMCKLRKALMDADSTRESAAISLLRAICLGALHGPLNKGSTPSSYFSNQMMRTFAPKPDYAVRYWQKNRLIPPFSNVRDVIERRALRILNKLPQKAAHSSVRQQDARTMDSNRLEKVGIDWVVTSPPYYGMRTYDPDQWLRNWFAGGPEKPIYVSEEQLQHHSPADFALELASVWDRVGKYAFESTKLVVRFGAIGSRPVDYDDVFKESLIESNYPWRLITSRPAGDASSGRRQSITMGRHGNPQSVAEKDFYVGLAG